MGFLKGDKVQKGTSPAVYTVVRSQGKTGWLWLESVSGHRFKVHVDEDAVCPAQVEES